VFVVKFPVINVVYFATTLVNKDDNIVCYVMLKLLHIVSVTHRGTAQHRGAKSDVYECTLVLVLGVRRRVCECRYSSFMQADHSVNGSCSPGRRKPRYGRTGPRLGRNHARTRAMYRLQCISAVGLDKILSSGGPEKMDLSIRKASRSDAINWGRLLLRSRGCYDAGTEL